MLRIFNVMKTWISKHGYDFIEEPKLYKQAQELKKLMAKEMKKQSEQINDMLEKLV